MRLKVKLVESNVNPGSISGTVVDLDTGEVRYASPLFRGRGCRAKARKSAKDIMRILKGN